MIIAGFFIDNIFIYLLLLLVIAIIYFVGGDDAKKLIKNFLVRTWFILIIIGILIYGWNRWGIVADTGIGQMKTALFWALEIGALYLIGKNWLYELRYETTPFQAGGIYGSCSRYYSVGRLTVFYLGTTGKSYTKGFMLNWNFPNKIVIIPTNLWHFNGEGIYSRVLVSKRMIEQLPSEKIRNSINNDPLTFFARDEIYFGLYRDKDITDKPFLEDTESRLLDFSVENSLQKEMIEGKNTIMKKHVTDIKAIENKMTNKSSYQQPQNIGDEGA